MDNEPISKNFGVLESWDLALSRENNSFVRVWTFGEEKIYFWQKCWIIMEKT